MTLTFVYAVPSVITPLLYVLGAVVGVAIGTLFVWMVSKSDDAHSERVRVERVAKLAARRAVDETLRGIRPRDHGRV